MSEVKVNKLSPRSGTTVTIGDSGDTINIVGTLQNNGSAIPGDISSVVAGTGLSGGGTSGDVTLNIEAAQPTITSLGTLTSATISGDLTVDTNTLFVDASENTVVVGGTDASSWNANADELVVAGASAGGMTFYNPTQTNIFFADGTTGDDVSRGRIQYIHTNNALIFGTDATERMRIDASGDVGVGTNNPAEKLQVMDTASNIPKIRIETSDGGNKRLDLSVESSVGTIASTQSAQQLAFKTAGGEAVRIDATGNVGIGTTSPTSPLMVQSNETYPIHVKGANAKAILVETTGGETELAILQLKNSAYTWNVENGRSANTLTFYANSGGERMRINSSGNVGIGTSSPTTALDVNGTVKATGFDGANAPAWSAKRSSAQTGIADNTSVLIICDSEDFDTDNAYNTSTGIFTVPSGKGGKYMVGAAYRTNGSGASGRIATTLFVGTNVVRQTNFNQTSGGESSGTCHAVLNLSAGDEVSFKLFQTSGSAVNAEASGKTYFYGYKIG